MTDAGLGRTDFHLRDRCSRPTIDGVGLGAVVQRGAGAVRVDIVDLIRRDLGGITGVIHRGESGVSVGMGLGQMMSVGRRSVADDFAEDHRVPAPGGFKTFERQHGGAFTQREAVAMFIEGTTDIGRQGLQRIESREHELAQSVVSTGQRTIRASRPDQLPGMTDGIGARGAGVGNDGDGTDAAKGVEKIHGLSLRLIMRDALGLLLVTMRRLGGLPIIRLAQAHAATRRAQNDGKIGRGQPPGLRPGLVSRDQQEF